MFYLVGFFGTSSTGGSISNNSEKTAPRMGGGATFYRSFTTNDRYFKVKRLLLIKENQVFKVTEFSTFPCIGR